MRQPRTREGLEDRLALFEKRKGSILQFAERIRELAREVGDAGTAQVLDEFMGRFSSNRFLLLVVGDFKSGKSSLVNALVERAVCPVKATPRTAKVTRLSGTLHPDDAEALEITFQEDRRVERHPLESTSLEELVAVNGSRGGQVQLVDVYLKPSARLLRHPVRLVDTPGLGSGDGEQSRMTRDYIQHADALVFVFSAVKPFSDSERDFLLSHRALLERTLLVVNQMDRIPEEERGDVLEHIRQGLQRDIVEKGGAVPVLHPVSAAEALSGLRKGEGALRKSSGVPRLVEAIEALLTDEHSARLLESIVDQQLQICSVLSERAALAAEAMLSSPTVAGGLKSRIPRLRSELREMAGRRGAIEQALRQQEAAWVLAAPGHALRIRDELLESISEWIAQCPSEESCKQGLAAALAKDLAPRLERLDEALTAGYAQASKDACAALDELLRGMETRVREILTPERQETLGGRLGAGVGGLSGLSAVAQRVGGPTGGYGVATAALAQVLAATSSVQILSVTAAISVVLAGFAGPMGWVIAGMTSLLAAFFGLNRSSTWRERIRAHIREQVDRQLVPHLSESIKDSVEHFCSGLAQELQERTDSVLGWLEAIIGPLAEGQEPRPRARRPEAARLRKSMQGIEEVRAELARFRSSLLARRSHRGG